jgi:hypothetical protein
MLQNYLKFNNVYFPNPVKSDSSQMTVEQVKQSEAGTDLVILVRASKLKWNFTFNLTPATRNLLKEICKRESVTMNYMNTDYTVRVRDYKETLQAGSEWSQDVDGLWVCTVTVTQY